MSDETPMTEDELWQSARKHHLAIVDDIPHPADMIGVMAIIMTNVLVAARIGGLPEEMIGNLFDSIKDDIDNAVANYETAAGSISVQ